MKYGSVDFSKFDIIDDESKNRDLVVYKELKLRKKTWINKHGAQVTIVEPV
jgi:hypothetical protein